MVHRINFDGPSVEKLSLGEALEAPAFPAQQPVDIGIDAHSYPESYPQLYAAESYDPPFGYPPSYQPDHSVGAASLPPYHGTSTMNRPSIPSTSSSSPQNRTFPPSIPAAYQHPQPQHPRSLPGSMGSLGGGPRALLPGSTSRSLNSASAPVSKATGAGMHVINPPAENPHFTPELAKLVAQDQHPSLTSDVRTDDDQPWTLERASVPPAFQSAAPIRRQEDHSVVHRRSGEDERGIVDHSSTAFGPPLPPTTTGSSAGAFILSSRGPDTTLRDLKTSSPEEQTNLNRRLDDILLKYGRYLEREEQDLHLPRAPAASNGFSEEDLRWGGGAVVASTASALPKSIIFGTGTDIDEVVEFSNEHSPHRSPKSNFFRSSEDFPIEEESVPLVPLAGNGDPPPAAASASSGGSSSQDAAIFPHQYEFFVENISTSVRRATAPSSPGEPPAVVPPVLPEKMRMHRASSAAVRSPVATGVTLAHVRAVSSGRSSGSGSPVRSPTAAEQALDAQEEDTTMIAPQHTTDPSTGGAYTTSSASSGSADPSRYLFRISKKQPTLDEIQARSRYGVAALNSVEPPHSSGAVRTTSAGATSSAPSGTRTDSLLVVPGTDDLVVVSSPPAGSPTGGVGVPDGGRVVGSSSPTSPQRKRADCVVCLGGEATYACTPCGHLCLCGKCVAAVLDVCPVCRTAVQMTVRIYS